MNQIVFDIGAHDGQDSEFYLKKGFSVVAVEANPTLCADLRSRFASQLRSGQLILVEKAIAATDGEISFFVNHKESIWGTTRHDVALNQAARSSDISEIKVPSIRFSELISRYGVPYYLKIDIEGTDHLCLEDLDGVSIRPTFISTEIDQASWKDFNMSMRLLAKLGYRRFKMINQALVPKQESPCPASEGNAVPHRFDLGSAGLFGSELPGPWQSSANIKAQYLRIVGGNKLHGLLRTAGMNVNRTGSWYDVHAMA